ncbi:iron complex outermembrane receptor protein [Paucibacter oligotrophus]|uniref:Iron complex outermembrane receptor protein n=1 Tax=Roseateles oligotrophus TaxID=1769250 RepID=A0A840L5I8_9BURK|nr:TonB-dependent receptor [Roseateles oligotrophus]MBB4843814.1 iron complex outermembrane receptor protein [Roseateles oligotrophus]
MKLQFKAIASATFSLTLSLGSQAQVGDATPSTRLQPVQIDGKASGKLGLKASQSTASRLGLTALETPASVEVLDVETLRARGDTGVAELVGRATGLQAMGSPGSGSTYSSRGFTGNDSVAQAEDGLRMPTASGTQSSPSDSFGFESIEILRGPASVLYGDGAIGGLINLVRKQPGRQASQELTAGLGSDGAYRLGLGLAQPLAERFSLRLDALAKGGPGLVERSAYKNRKLMSTLRWQAAENLRLDFSLDIHRDQPGAYFGTPLKAGKLWRELQGENYNIEDSLWQMDQERARLRLDWTLNENVSARVLAYRFQADRQWRNLEKYALSADALTVNRSEYLAIQHRLRQQGLRAELIATPLAQLKLSSGVELMKMDFRHSNDLYDFTTVSKVGLHDFAPGRYLLPTERLLPRLETQTRQQALFAEGLWQLSPAWSLSAGLRKERTEMDRQTLSPKPDAWDAEFSPLSWRLGAVYQLDAQTSLYAQTSSGTDPVGTVATLQKASKDLRLTEGRQVELGYKQAGKLLEWSLALYQIRKDHILTPDPVTPSIQIQGGSLQSRGLELTAAWMPAPGWRLDANAAWVQAEYLQLFDSKGLSLAGNRPPNVARLSGNLWLGYVQGPLELGAGLRHVGERFINQANSQSLPGYQVMDASLGWHFNSATTLRLQLRNLRDELYATSSYGSTQAMLGRERRADLVLDLRF